MCHDSMFWKVDESKSEMSEIPERKSMQGQGRGQEKGEGVQGKVSKARPQM